MTSRGGAGGRRCRATVTGVMDIGGLDPHMARCFELAWQACARGTVGVGARLVGGDGTVMAEGSNGLFADAVGPLSGNKIAHAEMNALAQIEAGVDLTGATLYTSLEPCFMCAGAAMLSRVGRIVIGTADPYMTGVDAFYDSGDTRTQRTHREVQPDPAWAALSRVLSLHAAFFWIPGSEVVEAAHADEPEVASLVAELVVAGTVASMAETQASLGDVVETLAPRIATALR